MTIGHEATVWILFGRNLDQGPHSRALDRAFTQQFGEGYTAWFTDELFMTIRNGRLGLVDRVGHAIAPPLVAYTRLSTVHLQSDREITLLRHLEHMGVTVLNSSDAILCCVNKFWHLQTLATHGLPVPDTITYVDTLREYLLTAATGIPNLNAPYVVKAVRGHRGSNVFLVSSPTSFHDGRADPLTPMPVLIQEYVQCSHGRDLRVIVIDGQPVAAYVRQANDGRVTSNVHQGGSRYHCLGLHPLAENLAVDAARVLGLTFAGVDLLFQADGSFTICEVNNNFAWETSTDHVPSAIAQAISNRQQPAIIAQQLAEAENTVAIKASGSFNR